MGNIFTDHPRSIGETYFKHLRFATLLGFQMIVGGAACMMHAIFPFIFQKTGSQLLFKVTKKCIQRSPTLGEEAKELLQVIESKIE